MALVLTRNFFLGGAQLIAQRLVARLERENGGGLFAELDLEPIDGVALLAELGELAGASGLELLDAHFQPPRRHGEFGAQLILVGLDFGHRQRRRGFEPPHCQAYGAVVDERNDNEPDQSRDQKADPEIHDRFDHGTYASNSRKFGEIQGIGTDRPPRRRTINLNPAQPSRVKKVQAIESEKLVNAPAVRTGSRSPAA